MTKKEIQALIDKDFGGDVNKFYEKYPTIESFRDGGRKKFTPRTEHMEVWDNGKFKYDREGKKISNVQQRLKDEGGKRYWGDVDPKSDVYKKFKHNARASNKVDKLNYKYPNLYQGNKEYEPSTEFIKQLEYQKNLQEGDTDFYRKSDTDVLGKIAMEDMGTTPTPTTRKDFRRANRYSNSPDGYAYDAMRAEGFKNGGQLPSFQYGTVDTGTQMGSYNAFNMDSYAPEMDTNTFDASKYETKDFMGDVTTSSDAMTNSMPGVSGINQVGSAIGNKARTGAFEKYNEDGTLKNPGLAKVGSAIGGLFNPMLALKTRQETGNWGFSNPFKKDPKTGKRDFSPRNVFSHDPGGSGQYVSDLEEQGVRNVEKQTELENLYQTNYLEGQDAATTAAITSGQTQQPVSVYQSFYGGQQGVNPVAMRSGGEVPDNAQYMLDDKEVVISRNGDMSQVNATKPGVDTVATTENNNGNPVALSGGNLVPLHKAEDGGQVSDSTYVATNNFGKDGFEDISKAELDRIMKLG